MYDCAVKKLGMMAVIYLRSVKPSQRKEQQRCESSESRPSASSNTIRFSGRIGHSPYSTSEASQATERRVSDATKQRNNDVVRAQNQDTLRLQAQSGSQHGTWEIAGR